MQRFSRSLIAVIVLILVAGVALPAEEALPPAQKIIDDYVDAIGGRKLLKKQESFEVVGTFSIPAAGLTGELKIYSKAPNMNLVRIELPGMGQIQEGFDGKVAWATDPTQGPMVKDGKAAEQALFRSDFYAALHEEGRYKSMETVEQVEFEGRDCYKVRLVTSGDDEVFEYYDLETKFMVGTDMSAETPMGAVDITAVMEEYKAFGGLSLPTKITQKMVGMAQVMTIVEVQANTLDSTVFELPAAIKALSEPAPEAAK
jgi:hypothetical protein